VLPDEEVDVPVEDVCQYHVTPAGGLAFLVITVLPQFWV
jgi:hypothetical protein